MSFIPESEFRWRPDTYALIPFAGLAVILNTDRDAFHAFLQEHGYEVIALDCSAGIREFRKQLDPVISYEREIGIPLTDQQSLDALNDGWSLDPDPPRRLVLELIGADGMWAEDPEWTRGFLSIASEMSRRHLVGGSLLFTALVLPDNSPLIGKEVGSVSIPSPIYGSDFDRRSE